MTTLGMFARHPEPGKTKTRLAATIGDQAAAEVYACFVRDLVQRTASLANHQWLAITPETSEAKNWFEQLPVVHAENNRQLLVQPDGGLGERVAWFFQEACRQGSGPAVLIGSDSPDLPDCRIEQAFELLTGDEADIVVVPATDGGYTLIGLSGDPGGLFDNIRWSNPYTLLDTIRAAKTAGRRLEVLPAWYDVDHIENLGTLAALQQCPGRTQAAACPATFAYLRQLMIDGVEG